MIEHRATSGAHGPAVLRRQSAQITVPQRTCSMALSAANSDLGRDSISSGANMHAQWLLQ